MCDVVGNHPGTAPNKRISLGGGIIEGFRPLQRLGQFDNVSTGGRLHPYDFLMWRRDHGWQGRPPTRFVDSDVPARLYAAIRSR
jgi:hypothetical protein